LIAWKEQKEQKPDLQVSEGPAFNGAGVERHGTRAVGGRGRVRLGL